MLYKITKIVRARSDWPRGVFAWDYVNMVVASRNCVKMLCFLLANHASTNLKKFSSSKLAKFYTLFTHSFVSWNLENRYKEGVSILFRLSWHFKRKKPVFWKAPFFVKQRLITRTSFVHKTSRLVRISLLINALSKRVLLFFSGKLSYKSNRKLFSCVCISWYKHSRGWDNYNRLCKHGKRFLLLNYGTV